MKHLEGNPTEGYEKIRELAHQHTLEAFKERTNGLLSSYTRR